MPIITDWFDKQENIILQQYINDWTVEETQKGNEEISIQIKNDLINDNIKVFESHGFEISKLPLSLIPLANSKNCKFEIIQYKGKQIFGTQFHPEMSPDGKNLIISFCLL